MKILKLKTISVLVLLLYLSSSAASELLEWKIDGMPYYAWPSAGHCWYIRDDYTLSYAPDFSLPNGNAIPSSAKNVRDPRDSSGIIYDYVVPPHARLTLGDIGLYNSRCVDGVTDRWRQILKLFLDGEDSGATNGSVLTGHQACMDIYPSRKIRIIEDGYSDVDVKCPSCWAKSNDWAEVCPEDAPFLRGLGQKVERTVDPSYRVKAKLFCSNANGRNSKTISISQVNPKPGNICYECWGYSGEDGAAEFSWQNNCPPESQYLVGLKQVKDPATETYTGYLICSSDPEELVSEVEVALSTGGVGVSSSWLSGGSWEKKCPTGQAVIGLEQKKEGTNIKGKLLCAYPNDVMIDPETQNPGIVMKGASEKLNYNFPDSPGPHRLSLRVNTGFTANYWHAHKDYNILITDIDYNVTFPDGPNSLFGFIRGRDQSQKEDSFLNRQFVFTVSNLAANSLKIIGANIQCPSPYLDCSINPAQFSGPSGMILYPKGNGSESSGIIVDVNVYSPARSPDLASILVDLTVEDIYGFERETGIITTKSTDVGLSFNLTQTAISPYSKTGTIALEANVPYYVQFCAQTVNDDQALANFYIRNADGEDLLNIGFHGISDCSSPDFGGGEESVSTIMLSESQTLDWEYAGLVGLRGEHEDDWVRIGTRLDSGGYVRDLVREIKMNDGQPQEKIFSAVVSPTGSVNRDEKTKRISGFTPPEATGTNIGLKAYELSNIVFDYSPESGIQDYASQEPASSVSDGTTSLEVSRNGTVKARTSAYEVSLAEAPFKGNVELIWEWKEEYMAKLFAGLEGACYGKNERIGFTGENVAPRVKYQWDWATTGSSAIDINACVNQDNANSDYIYCDATQFTEMLLQRLHYLEENADELTSSEITALLNFNAYLMYDGFSQDFRSDFDNYMKNDSSYGTVPSWYEGELWGDYILGEDRLQFVIKDSDDSIQENKVLPGAGFYEVTIGVYFEPGNDYAFRHSGAIDAGIIVNLKKINSAKYDNPLYYMPIDAQLGFEDGVLKRNSYGSAFTSPNLANLSDMVIWSDLLGSARVTALPSDISASSPLVVINVKPKIDEKKYFEYVQFESPGTILSLEKTQEASTTQPLKFDLNYTPSYATKVAGKTEKHSTNVFAGMFYAIQDSRGNYLSDGINHMNSWTAFAETIDRDSECSDYAGNSLRTFFDERADFKSTEFDDGLHSIYSSDSYGHGWDTDLSGAIYWGTVFFTPYTVAREYKFLNTGYQGKFLKISENNWKDAVINDSSPEFFYLNDNPGDTAKSISRNISGLKNTELCMQWNNNYISLFWNYGKLLADINSSLIGSGEYPEYCNTYP